MKSYLILISVIFASSQVYSQVDVGLMLTSNYGALLEASDRNYDSNTSVGIGVLVRKVSQSKMYYTHSISYQKVGWTSNDYKIGGEAQNVNVDWKGKSIIGSTELGYFLLRSDKLAIGTSLGIDIRYVFDDEYQVTEDLSKGYSDIVINQQGLASLGFNLDVIYSISEKWNVNLRPNWSSYLRFNDNDYTERNFGLDVAVSYSL